jgi:acetyl-CoA synthetase
MMKTISSMEEYHKVYAESVADPEEFWASIADNFNWRRKWDTVLQWDFSKPEVKWFDGAQLNITENCLDRHLQTQPEQAAIIWEPNELSDAPQKITYRRLHQEVCRMANVLKAHGIQKGDRVCIYLPMIPQLAYALLACARIGAVHSVVFAGFSSRSLADRINDSLCKLLITSDGAYRGNKTIAMKAISDEALEQTSSIEKVLVVKRTGEAVNMQADRDLWLEDELQKVNDYCDAVTVEAEDPLFILYTSGSTGKPKGIMHTTAGYMVYAEYSFRNVFQYQPGEVFWCTADIGWITGHSYIVYGPLLAGGTSLLFEGIPTYPDAGRFWEVIDKHQVNIFYTAPTAIRSLIAHDPELPLKYNLSSLRVLGSVGEPINQEAWEWYHEKVGRKQCPIVDTWWQTENGGIMISPLAGITPLKPAFATLPLPGIQPAFVDEKGNEIFGNEVEGRLCIKFPWPSIARTIYGDHQRFYDTYFSTFKGKYFTGDGSRRDADGYYRITGRVDDVIIVSGHNLGTAEIENAIDEHELVVETAVVGYPHDIKGSAVYAYVTLHDHDKADHDKVRKEILDIVSRIIGPIAKPEKIQFVKGLPKTRSGKIMRRILRKIAEKDMSNLGDTSTLLDPGVVDDIKEGAL